MGLCNWRNNNHIIYANTCYLFTWHHNAGIKGYQYYYYRQFVVLPSLSQRYLWANEITPRSKYFCICNITLSIPIDRSSIRSDRLLVVLDLFNRCMWRDGKKLAVVGWSNCHIIIKGDTAICRRVKVCQSSDNNILPDWGLATPQRPYNYTLDGRQQCTDSGRLEALWGRQGGAT